MSVGFKQVLKEYDNAIKTSLLDEEMSKISIQKRVVFYNFLFSLFFIFCAFYNLHSFESSMDYRIYSTIVVIIAPLSLVNLFLNIHRLILLKKHRFISIEIGEFGNHISNEEAYDIWVKTYNLVREEEDLSIVLRKNDSSCDCNN